MTPKEISHLLSKTRFHYRSETDLQISISKILTQEQILHRREVVLSPRFRIDFMIGNTGLEVKVDGSLAGITRQLWKYSLFPQIQNLILVTTKMQHRRLPLQMNGKDLFVVCLSPAFY